MRDDQLIACCFDPLLARCYSPEHVAHYTKRFDAKCLYPQYSCSVLFTTTLKNLTKLREEYFLTVHTAADKIDVLNHTSIYTF